MKQTSKRGRSVPRWRRLVVVLFVGLALTVALFAFALVPPARDPDVPSTCYGTTADGALRDPCRLALDGPNFQAYSSLGVALGRTWVHCKVAEVVEGAYALLAESHPEVTFVYGETGFREGGRFKPHRTHQNGLSVDFMVPVLREGSPALFPARATEKFGYDLEFDASGRLGDLQIDFETLAAHLAALRISAAEAGIGIWRVILDPELQPFLHSTASWPAIRTLEFSKRRSWVRHDEHYHVDFELPCKPMTELK